MASRYLVMTSLFAVFASAIIASPSSIASPTPSGSNESGATPLSIETGAEPQGADDGLSIIQRMARDTGRSVEDVVAVEKITDQWSPVLAAVLNASPGTFIGTKMPLLPQEPIELHLKGKVSPKVEEIIKMSGLNVIIRDGQPYSYDEIIKLQATMIEILRKIGVGDYASSMGLPASGAELDLHIPRQDGWDAEKVRQVLVTGLPQPFMALLSVSDYAPTGNPALNFDSAVAPVPDARGGLLASRPDGPGYTSYCTLGYSVLHKTGVSGVSSAAHCGPLDTYYSDSNNVAGSLTIAGSHFGAWGDAAWFRTATSQPEIYERAGKTMNIDTVRLVQEIGVGNTVCLYGRGFLETRVKPNPSCDTVWRLAGRCGTDNDLNNLFVMSSSNTAIGGDSGGPWYGDHTAVGTHVGSCVPLADRELFSAADRFDEAIEVKVRARDWLVREETLSPGQEKMSKSGVVKLVMQTDGNLVKYTQYSNGWVAGWQSGTSTPGSRAVMQGDGNFVVYRPNNTAAWQSGTTNQPGSYVKVQNDNNVVIYNNGRSALWWTN